MNTISSLCATTTVGAAALGYAFGIPRNSIDIDTPIRGFPKAITGQRPGKRWSFMRSRDNSMSQLTTSPRSDSQDKLTTEGRSQSGAGQRRDQGSPSNFDLSRNNGSKHKDDVFRTTSPPNRKPSPQRSTEKLVVPQQRTRPASWAVPSTSHSRMKPNMQQTNHQIHEEQPSSYVVPSNSMEGSSSQPQRSSSGNLVGLKQTWKRGDPNQRRSLHMDSFASSKSMEADIRTANNNDIATPPMQSRPYKHYFSVTVENESGLSSRPGIRQTDHVHKIRRIRPSSRQQPILVLGNAVTASEMVDNGAARGTGVRPLESRKSMSTDNDNGLYSPFGDKAVSAEPESRRSFSLSNLLPRSISFRRNPDEVDVPRHTTQRPLGQRITSAPVFGNTRNKLSEEYGKSQSTNHEDFFPTGTDGGHITSGSRLRGILDHGDDLDRMANDTAYHNHILPSEPVPRTNHRYRHEGQSPPDLTSCTQFAQPVSRLSHFSASISELTSSRIGSEGSGRVFSSCDDDDGDIRSETIYDSTRTDTKFERGAFPGALFDQDGCTAIDHDPVLSSFDDIPSHRIPMSMNSGTNLIQEEDAAFPTLVGNKNLEIEPDTASSSSAHLASSTEIGSALAMQKLEWSLRERDDPFEWSDIEEPSFTTPHEKCVGFNSGISSQFSGFHHSSSSAVSFDPTSSELPTDSDHEGKMNVFDWSEQPAVERVVSAGQARPKTIHGARNTVTRASRSNGRRAPSGSHARSQSVPALSDQADNRVGGTSKFGTWGIGTKGASEDWDDDFDFSGPTNITISDIGVEQEYANLTKTIFIPQTIREQQSNVLANIGLLKEWGILIEELKELRQKANMLGVAAREFQSTFDEVDAMIDLADQESEEPVDADLTPSPSPLPEFDYDEHDRFASDTPLSVRGSEIFTDATTRPRKNSEAIALSVIETIQKRKSLPDRTPHQSPTRAKAKGKVPFDKGTLKHILPHLTNLVKSMKKILRNAEGLGVSPEQRSKRLDPAFSQAFVAPADNLPTMIGGKGLRLDFALKTDDWDYS